MRKTIHINPPIDPVAPVRTVLSWRAPLRKSLAETGRELWSELHTTVTIETLPQWEEKIPNYSCKCKEFYTAWKASNPPRKDDFFAWTVELHNAVNAKLEKPIITLQQAREIWMT